MNRRQPPRRIDEPEPCFVRMRLDRRTGWVPARITRTIAGLVADINGVSAPVDSVWTSGEMITEAQWRQLSADLKRPPPF
jgi:hypothetical protein